MLTFYNLFNDNKKNGRPNLFKPFFFKYCWTNCTLKWGKKIIYWLHFLNLPPLRELQQIFVLYEAKVMIYWQKSGKNTKSWPHLFNFECKQKILEVTHALPMYSDVLSLHILLVWADLHISWFSDDYPLFLQLLVFLLQ